VASCRYLDGTSITNTWDWDIQAAGAACSKDYLGNPQQPEVATACALYSARRNRLSSPLS